MRLCTSGASYIRETVQQTDPLAGAVSRFGASLKPKFSGAAVTGSPEDQLRGPLETLVQDVAGALMPAADVVMIGETSLVELETRPDFAVAKQNLLVGFIEVKAPGKGADPRRFYDRHDKAQWQKLRSLPKEPPQKL
jgi:hypothetical protein